MQSVKNLCHFICPRYCFLEQIGEETGGRDCRLYTQLLSVSVKKRNGDVGFREH